MPTILLIRHGQASFGAADYDVLSPLGREQSELAGAALRRRLPATRFRLVAGDLRRQRETAAALGLAAEVTSDSGWNEFESEEIFRHHGVVSASLEGPEAEAISSREFQDRLDPALAAWVAAGADSPTRQSWERYRDAAMAALEALAGELSRGEVGIAVSSAGTISALCARLLGCEGAFVGLNRVQVNSGVTKVAIGRRGATLVTMNDHSHLETGDRRLVTYR